MGELLEALHRLQTVELQLAQLRRGQETRNRRIDAQNRQLKKIDDRLESARYRLHDLGEGHADSFLAPMRRRDAERPVRRAARRFRS